MLPATRNSLNDAPALLDSPIQSDGVAILQGAQGTPRDHATGIFEGSKHTFFSDPSSWVNTFGAYPNAYPNGYESDMESSRLSELE